MAFVASADADSSSTSSLLCNVPTGTADNDILFMVIKRVGSTGPNSGITGVWTLAGTTNITSGNTVWLYWRLAASEPASYTIGWAAAARTGITIAGYRGGFNTASPIDVVSNTGYETSNTTVRAATMSVAAANSTIVFVGCVNQSSSVTFTAPTVPATFTEDSDSYSAASRFARTFASLVWTGSGATGSMDGTSSSTTTDKHAFAVALNPASAAAASLVIPMNFPTALLCM